MRLHWETDYALRCVLCLAAKESGMVRATELVRDIAAPEYVARKMITRLSSAGILQAKPGPKGGVCLARSPDKISVYDVVSCIEGELCINRCLGKEGTCTRDAIDSCSVHRYLERLQTEMESSMKKMTFDKLVKQNSSLKRVKNSTSKNEISTKLRLSVCAECKDKELFSL